VFSGLGLVLLYSCLSAEYFIPRFHKIMAIWDEKERKTL
jgi:hypothetical protein